MKVTFYSPGTLVCENTVLETDLTDPLQIAQLARGITERHGATPHSFRIDNEDKLYWLGGDILTLADVPDTPENKTLRWNMIHNDFDRIIINSNSWKFTSPFYPNDVLLEWKP